MFYFTMKMDTDARPSLAGTYAGSDEANAAKATLAGMFPTAEFSDVFEESADYPNTYPHVQARVSNLDGSEDHVWSDGVHTPV